MGGGIFGKSLSAAWGRRAGTLSGAQEHHVNAQVRGRSSKRGPPTPASGSPVSKRSQPQELEA